MKITLVGNYLPDRQQSMLRYATLLNDGLAKAGHDVRLIVPKQRLSRAGIGGVRKWIGYVDKFVLNWPDLRTAQRDADIVHVCDHSNSMYVPTNRSIPHSVTCHDLLAVRGARGEIQDCTASATGRILQAWILSGLGRADAVACVSQATRSDFCRLLPGFKGVLEVVPNALNFDYRPLTEAEAKSTAPRLPASLAGRRYLLHVGSAHSRKNRETAIRALALIADRWDGALLFVGEPLSDPQRQLVSDSRLADRVLECIGPDNDILRALYGSAEALLFTSRHEGFGWPLIEAQACGCPVICSDVAPMPEVTGGAALYVDADDAAGFASKIMALEMNATIRQDLVDRGFSNAGAYSTGSMISGMETLLDRARRER